MDCDAVTVAPGIGKNSVAPFLVSIRQNAGDPRQLDIQPGQPGISQMDKQEGTVAATKQGRAPGTTAGQPGPARRSGGRHSPGAIRRGAPHRAGRASCYGSMRRCAGGDQPVRLAAGGFNDHCGLLGRLPPAASSLPGQGGPCRKARAAAMEVRAEMVRNC